MAIDASVRPVLRPSEQQVRGVFGVEHTPVGEITLRLGIPSLHLVADYDVIVDNIEDELILDNSFMVYAQIDNFYAQGKLVRGPHSTRAIPCVSRVKQCRRISLQHSVVVAPHSRQILPGKVNFKGGLQPDPLWVIEPAHTFAEKTKILAAQSVCSHEQVCTGIPVEVYNPGDEPVQLLKDTTLGLISPARLESGVEPLRVDKVSQPVSQTGGISFKGPGVELPDELEEMVARAKGGLTSQEYEQFRRLIFQYQDIWALKGEPLGKTNATLHDIVTGMADPIKCRMRHPPLGLKEAAMAEEERMKEMGVIEPSDAPWASPVVLVRKKDGSLRYCIDYRRINEVTKKDSYPLPLMQDCLASLGGARHFSTMDLSSGYWQVGLTESAKDKTSFYGIGGGLWRFKVMPFGLCNAPATFERLMERVLGQLQWQICLCYIDDVLVYSRTPSEHLARLELVFDRLRTAHLRLKAKKCQFFRPEVVFLGHVVSRNGISTDPEKIDKVLNCPDPQNLHEVRSLVGFLSYYRKFVPNFATIARPMVRLTEKDVQFKWGVEQHESFKELKRLLTTAPVLAYPVSEGEFLLDTDASDVGIGAVLSQIQDGAERVVAYGSHMLSKAEKNYCVTRREMLAVVHFTDKYRHFLIGRHFTVRTDNSAVRYWKSMTYKPVGQVARWVEKLQSFDFSAIHRPGKQHLNADGLSRPPFVQCSQCDLRHRGALESKRGSPKVRSIGCQAVPQQSKVRPSRGQQVGAPAGKVLRHQPEPILVKSKPVLAQTPETIDSSETQGKSQGSGEVTSKTPVARPIGSRLKCPRGQGLAPSSWMQGGVDLDRALLRDEQRKDPACVDALVWVQQGVKPTKEEVMPLSRDHKFLWSNLECLAEQEGILMKVVEPLLGGGKNSFAVIPPSLRREVIRLCHDTVTSGHFYYFKTLGLVRRHFIWAGMSRDIGDYCRGCPICATRKTTGRKGQAPMRRYDSGMPMEEVAIDIMGPFPVSEKGNKYVLVVVDSFSKWMEAYPLPDTGAKAVAEVFVKQFVSRFGVPFWIKSDLARNFKCELFSHLCELLQVTHKTSTAFHPQGNSRVERMVKVVGNLLAAFCDSQKTWDENLPLLTMAYRSTIHEVTGYSPNYVMLGREISLPLDIMLGIAAPEERAPVHDYVQTLKERLKTCFEQVREQLKAYGERQKKYYNLSTRGELFKVGSVVYMLEKTRKIGVSPKLSPKWKGPYLVLKKFGTVFEIQITKKKSKLVHFDLLKECHSLEAPGWLIKAQRQLKGNTEINI